MNKALRNIRELEASLPELDAPLTFNYSSFGEIIPIDVYFSKGPVKNINDGEISAKSIQEYSAYFVKHIDYLANPSIRNK